MAKAKTINLLLNDGTLRGVISLEDSSWNKGELYSAPRETVDALISTDACSRYGVYLLLSEDMVYVGQASDLSKRIKQHLVGKSWWERVVILTTSDDSLNRSDIDYIEASLISKASKIDRLDCDNKTMGNKQKVSKFREVELEQYLDEALFLLELIGITVFCDTINKKKKTLKISHPVSNSEKHTTIETKKEAVDFLTSHGVTIDGNSTFASHQKNKNVFWANPCVDVLENDWTLILRNQFSRELIVMKIPKNSFIVGLEGGIMTRNDKPDKLDINIFEDSFIERRSKCDFSGFVTKIFKY